MNVHELNTQMLEARRELDAALTEHVRCVHEQASTDRVSRIAKATAYIAATGTAGERQAAVDQSTADVQYAAKLADGLERAALEAVRSKRQVLSALQSLAASNREEAALARYESRETASA